MESSRTHFEVLGLEASSLGKLPCPRLEDSTIFLICQNFADRLKNFIKTFCFGERLKKNFEDLFFWGGGIFALVFLVLAFSIPVLGLERVCPWPRIFFGVLDLGLEPCVLDSTSAIYIKYCLNTRRDFHAKI